MDPSPSTRTDEDPISKSALIKGIVACCIAGFPVGSIIGIILGVQARKRARLGKEAIEASGGVLRGKGAHIAANICGLVAIILGAIMTAYWGIAMIGFIVALAGGG
jgi:hypothetical protein